MEILRHAVVLVHLVGFAVLFGAWVVEAVGQRRITRGEGLAGLPGLFPGRGAFRGRPQRAERARAALPPGPRIPPPRPAFFPLRGPAFAIL